MTISQILRYAFVVITCAGVLQNVAQLPAAIIVNNGGFEAGLSGWTTADQLGSSGTFGVQSGTSSPLSGFAVPAPPQGNNAAMADQAGGGTSSVLYQDLSIPVSPQGLQYLTFQLFIRNTASDFYAPNRAPNPNPNTTPNSLDWATPLVNQQVRVDIVRATSNPFTMASADVLQNIYQSQPGDPLTSGYTTWVADISQVVAANLGGTVRLRFATVANVLELITGVDAVEIRSVPEPSTWIAFALIPAFGLASRWRRWLRNESTDEA